MTWQLRDLFVDHNTGRIRESKVWANIGKAAMTWAFCHVIYKGGSSEMLWAAYGTVMCGHETATRILNLRERNDASKPAA